MRFSILAVLVLQGIALVAADPLAGDCEPVTYIVHVEWQWLLIRFFGLLLQFHIPERTSDRLVRSVLIRVDNNARILILSWFTAGK